MNQLNIRDYGASQNSLCTKEIQNAINKLSEIGGGRLIFPAGKFITGALELKSNICYYFESGCILKASGDIKDYPYIGFYHHEMGETKSLLYALNKENITIAGDGLIDISDDAFVNFNSIIPFDVDLDTLTEEQKAECVVNRYGTHKDVINQPLFFESCKNVKVSDIKIIKSPLWTLTFSRCDDIKIRGITIDNNRVTPNSDGIHLCATKNAVISDCNIKAGDDCIALTCITAEEKNDICENIVITNCNLESSSAGIRIGHLHGKIRNVSISNINITNSNRGIAIFALTDAFVKNITISNIVMDTHILCGAWWGKGEPLVICAAKGDGIIENIYANNIIAHSDNGIVIVGENNNIRDIKITDFNLTLTNSENRKLFGGDIDLRMNHYIKRNSNTQFDKYVENAEVRLEGFCCRKG